MNENTNNPLAEPVTALLDAYAKLESGDAKNTDELQAKIEAVRAVATTPMPRKVPGVDPSRPAAGELAHFARNGRFSPMNAITIAGTGGEGGELVSPQLSREIFTVAQTYSSMLKIANVVTGVVGDYRANVATTIPATGWVGETGTRSVTTSPVFAQVAIPHGGVYAAVSLSNWILDDSQYNLDAWVTEEIGRAVGVALGTAFTTGDGSDKPKGLTAYTWVTTADSSRTFGQGQYVATGTSGGGVTIDKCLDALYSLKAEYRAPGRAAWLVAPAALQAIRQQKASTAGSYMWEPSSKDGQPSTLAGLPVYEDANLTLGANSFPVFVGDFKRGYTATMIAQPRLIRDNTTSRGNTIIYFEQRAGGAMIDSNAIKALKASTT